ncbi:MAG: hypothetical protein R3F29_02930 [Planctomycetota bacterium]
MQRETTPLARALMALVGLALSAVAGMTTLDATAGLDAPRSGDAGGRPMTGEVGRHCTPPPVPVDGAVLHEMAAAVVRDTRPDDAPVTHARSDDSERAAMHTVRALLVGRSAAGLLPDGFVAGFDASLSGVRSRRIDCSDRQVLSTMIGAGAELALLAGELTRNQVRSGLRQQTLGAELFLLQVAADAQPRSLGVAQVRRVFRGEVRDWRELGFAAGPIVPLVPGDAAVAERAARALLGGASFAACCVRDAGSLPRGGVRLVRLADAEPNNQLRLLRVDDVAPTPDAFFRGHYPLGLPLQLVTPGQPDGRAQQLLAFARSEEGRALLGGVLAFAD